MLIDYLNYGGNLYISSVELASSLEGTELLNYLGVDLMDIGPSYSVRNLTGINPEFQQDSYFPYKGGYDPHVNIDEIEPTTAEPIYISEDGKPRIFLNSTGAYNVISSSIVFGALKDNDSLNMKAFFIAEMIDYLKANSSLGMSKANKKNIQHNAFPNPSSTQISINFELLYQDFVEITIHDINGKQVSKIFDKQLPKGKHTATWNLHHQNGNKVDPGIYIYKIKTSNSNTSNRIAVF